MCNVHNNSKNLQINLQTTNMHHSHLQNIEFPLIQSLENLIRIQPSKTITNSFFLITKHNMKKKKRFQLNEDHLSVFLEHET